MSRAAIRTLCLLALLAAAALWPSRAVAQEPIFGPAATQPGAGVITLREQIRLTRFDADPTGAGRSGDDLVLDTTVAYGLRGDLALVFQAPLIWRDASLTGNDEEFGLGDPRVALKWRFHQADTGPTDTFRASLIGGLEAPSGDEPFTSDSIDPFVGVVGTIIRGRFGVNGGATLKINTSSSADASVVTRGDNDAAAFFYDLSGLYRLSPATYQPDTKAAVYGVIELNGLAETNGDHELMLAPGLLYEGTRWAFEVGVQIPIAQDLEHRLEREFVFAAGLRLLF